MSVVTEQCNEVKNGKQIVVFTVENKNGARMKVTNYGGIIMELWVPDQNGALQDVVLGFDNVGDYFTKSPFFGALVGRYANRIGNAVFSLNGKTYRLPVNENKNQLHGGIEGFDKKVLDYEIVGDASIRFSYTSADGEEGFPGELRMMATYTLTEQNGLKLDYTATSDQDTVINLTNHSYFNLDGEDDTLGCFVKLNADRFTCIDGEGIPTGEQREVAGTPLDFREYHSIGERIGADYEQLKLVQGYDHNYALNDTSWCAKAYSDKSGILMEVTTTLPGVQLYSGCCLPEIDGGKQGRHYGRYSGFCLETQYFPDSPNRPEFPSCVLKAGETWEQSTTYDFSVL